MTFERELRTADRSRATAYLMRADGMNVTAAIASTSGTPMIQTPSAMKTASKAAMTPRPRP